MTYNSNKQINQLDEAEIINGSTKFVVANNGKALYATRDELGLISAEELAEALTPYMTEDDINTLLSSYPTNTELENILSQYYTSSEVDTLLSGKADTASLGEVAFSNDYNDLDNTPSIPSQYTDEMAQDAVGNILADSDEIDFSYNDDTPSITATIKSASIDESKLDTSINESLDLADSAIQSGDNVSELNNDAGYLTDLINKESLDITRDVNGYIEEVEYAGGRTVTVSRTGNFITSKTDGVNTWTYNRDSNNRITSVSVV
jgi:hypothetical protein